MDKATTVRNSHFGARLKELRKSRNLTQQQFCKQYEKVTGCILSINSISNWENGYQYPSPDSRHGIYKTLEVDESAFMPNGYYDKHAFSSEFQREISHCSLYRSYHEGLKLRLILLLKELVPFGEYFPSYSPVIVPKDPFKIDKAPERISLTPAAAPLPEGEDWAQYEKDGQILTLNYADLSFLREVQDRVVECVLGCFAKREIEMKEELKKITILVDEYRNGENTPEAYQKLHQDIKEIDRLSSHYFEGLRMNQAVDSREEKNG